MYERILVPTDGSENTTAAVEQAIGLAETYDAEIHSLYVVNTGAMPSPEIDFREEFISEGERIGTEATESVVSAAREAAVSATGTIVHGTPYEEILDYAEANDVDLIVMATHGRTGLGHFLLGSVAERVIRHSDLPVLVVRSGAD